MASTSLRALLLAGLLTQLAGAQTELALREIPSGRGTTVLGEGGLTNFVTPQAVVGRLGAAVAWADLNADGFDDLIVGAPDLPAFPLSTSDDDAGHVYVVFGSATGGNPSVDPDFDLVGFTAGQAVNLVGRPGEMVGTSVAAIGDVDGDGNEDVLIGAPGHDLSGRSASGGAYILFGDPAFDTLDTRVELVTLINAASGMATFLLGGSEFAAAGMSVTGNVDVDADGIDDLVVGSPLESTNGRFNNGTARVVFGHAGLAGVASLDLADFTDPGEGVVVSGAQDFQLLGTSVAGLGAFDSVLPSGGNDLTDGDDIAIGAPGTLGSSGRFFAGAVYVLRGDSGAALPAALDTDDFGSGAGEAGPIYVGAATGDQFGSWVGALGDVTGEGFADMLVGAPFNDGPGKADAGSLYLLPGRFAATDPVGIDVSTIFVGDGQPAVQIQGAAAGDGELGVFGAAVGDFNNDGFTDVAVGFPASLANDSGGVPLPQAGNVRVLHGLLLSPAFIDIADLGLFGPDLTLMRLKGDAPAAHAGSALAAGDANADGWVDLAIGASGAPSDVDPADPTGLLFAKTGRAHTLFGPISRVGTITPGASHFEGPVVQLEVFNFDDDSSLAVTVDGVAVVPSATSTGSPGTIDLALPVPSVGSLGTDVDVTINGISGLVDMPDVLHLNELSILTGPEPAEVVPGLEVTFTGTAFSTDSDMSITFGGVAATITDVDTTAGTLTLAAPSGLAALTPLDVVIDNSNSAAPLTLSGAVTYRPFVVDAISPTSGSQSAGVNIPPGTPGFSYFGEDDLPVEFTISAASGTIDPDTKVEFGSDELSWREAEQVSIVSDVLTVNLPAFHLGPETVVDVRVSTDQDTILIEDAFTYEAGDYVEILETAKAGLGPEAPLCQMAGDFTPGSTALLLVHNYPLGTSQFGALFIGVELFDPFFPAKGGLLGVNQLITLVVPISFFEFVPVDFNLPSTLGPEGAKFYAQWVTKDVSGPTTSFGFSPTLEMTIRFE